MQAEAVADLIDAATPLQARAAFDQLDGTLTRAIAGIDATLFDLIARLEASVDFPEEGYHFVEPGALAQAIDGLLERTSALLARCAPRAADSRGAADRDRRRTERRQVEPVQRARRRVARDRHRRAGHDARSGHRDGRHRGSARHAGRHGGSARHRRSGGARRRRARAPGDRGRRPGAAGRGSVAAAIERQDVSQRVKFFIVANKSDLPRAWRRRSARCAVRRRPAKASTNCGGAIVGRARCRSAARSAGDDQRSPHRAGRARAPRRWRARARRRLRTAARCRKNSCSRICRTRAPRSKRSPDAARRRICSSTFSRGSVSANDVANGIARTRTFRGSGSALMVVT